MARSLDAILVIDLESTCWPGNPPEGQHSDIIEVGLSVLDATTLEIIESTGFLVKPERSKVSAFCTRLTTITPEMVADAPPLSEVIRTLKKRYRSKQRLWASYGDYDRKQFERCCEGLELGYPFGPSHLNVKTLAATTLGLKHEMGMAQMLERLGLPLEGTHHRGVDDARNIAGILGRVLAAGRSGLAHDP